MSQLATVRLRIFRLARNQPQSSRVYLAYVDCDLRRRPRTCEPTHPTSPNMTVQKPGLFSDSLLPLGGTPSVRNDLILDGLRRSPLGSKPLPQARRLLCKDYLNRCVAYDALGDRSTMEDAHYAGLRGELADKDAPPHRTSIFAVIDGCGGHDHGDLAGKIAAQFTQDAHGKGHFFEPPLWPLTVSALPFGNLSLHRFLAERLLAHLENVNDAIVCLSLPGLDLSALSQYLDKQTPAVLALRRSWKGNVPIEKAFLEALDAGEEFPEGPKAACVFGLSYGNLAIFANIGDCRCWRFTRNLGKAGFEGECLSVDDTLYGAEYALSICGASPEDDASGSSGLTRALGCLDIKKWIRKELRKRLFLRYFLATDVVLMCSDGFYGRFWNQHGFYPTEHLAEIIAASNSRNVKEKLASDAAKQPKLLYRNDEQMKLDNSTVLVGYSHGWY
jgi:serine/threonine protein phosphatase PrpC